MRKIIVILITLIASSAFAGQVVVEVAGQGDIVEADTIKARAEAFDMALKQAVEKGVERFLSDKTIAANQTTIEKRIYGRAGGYIRSFEITKEGVKPPPGNIYELTAKAGLVTENLEYDLSALGLLSFRKNLPRILVLIQEKNIDIVHWHFQSKSPNSAEDIIWNVLDIKGFKSIDQTGLMESLDADMEKAFYADDVASAINIGVDYNADVIITGKAISRTNRTAGELNDSLSVQAMVTLKAYLTKNGEEIAVSSTSASTVNINELQGGVIAIQKAAEKAALMLAPEIIDNWTATFEPPTFAITLLVNGLKSIEDLVTFKHEFTSRIPGIKTITRRTFSGSAAAYDLESTSDINTIVAELTANGLKSFDVSIRSQSEDSIELKVKIK